MKTRYFFFFIIIIFVVSCKPNLDEFTPASGSVDLSSYVAIGNSLTAGYTDGALYRSGQEYSYPNILAQQFRVAGGGEFRLPLMADDYGIGFRGVTPVTKLVLGYSTDCLGNVALAPVLPGVDINPANLQPIGDQGPYHNLGIPGMRMVHISIPQYGNLNPFFGRMVSNMGNSVLDEAILLQPTFFTLWLGNNDILGFALAGGESDPVTPPEMFGAALNGTLDVLTGTGAKGAIANIPYPLDAPYFNTIPYNGLVLSDQSTVDLLNAAYANLNMIIKGAGSTDTLAFHLGANAFVIADNSLPWGMRQAGSSDLLLLSIPQDSLKCAGWGSQKPIAEHHVLDEEEQGIINQAVADYNVIILEAIAGKEVAQVNARDLLKKIANEGLAVDGVTFSNEMVTGNTFSLDGIHMSPVANALLANEFISAINLRFGANIPLVIVGDYPSVTFPDEAL